MWLTNIELSMHSRPLGPMTNYLVELVDISIKANKYKKKNTESKLKCLESTNNSKFSCTNNDDMDYGLWIMDSGLNSSFSLE